MLSFRQLEVFRAVMLTGSISAAAHQLGIAQPTVTNTVRRLEDVLGALLFDRSGARLRPTALARQVFKVVNPSLAGFDHLTDQIAQIVRGHLASFGMGVSPSVSQGLAPRALKHFAVDRPDVRIRMDTLARLHYTEYLWLAEGDCTVTIIRPDDPAIISHEIAAYSLVVVLTADHRLARRDSVAIQDIAAERLIAFHPVAPLDPMLRAMFAAEGLVPNVSVETRFAMTGPHLMREGFGIAVIDELSALGIHDPALRVLPLEGAPSQPVLLNYLRDNSVEPDIALIRRHLIRAAEELGCAIAPPQAAGVIAQSDSFR